MKIQLTQQTFNRKKLTDTEVRDISLTEYDLLTNKDTLKFFRQLGGNETIKRTYTSQGYNITYLSSTSPDKEIKIVRKFKFS